MVEPECDEYPYFKTLEAYEGALNVGPLAMVPSIRFEPHKENNLEGRALGHFFSSNKGGTGPNSWLFDGCSIPQANDPTTKSLGPVAGYAAAEPSAFLVVPLGAHTDIKTLGFCNKPAAPAG